MTTPLRRIALGLSLTSLALMYLSAIFCPRPEAPSLVGMALVGPGWLLLLCDYWGRKS